MKNKAYWQKIFKKASCSNCYEDDPCNRLIQETNQGDGTELCIAMVKLYDIGVLKDE